MKIFPILSAALACGLIASSCAVKNTSLSRPVSSVPSENSSAISQLSSQNSSEISPETMVSSMIAAFYAASSAADQTPSAPASCIITSSASSDNTSVTYDSVSAVPLPEGLYESMASPGRVMMCRISADGASMPAKDMEKAMAKVRTMLKNAEPFSGMLPRSPNRQFIFYGDPGPCSLYEETLDGHKVDITPYTYFSCATASSPGGWKESTSLNYVPDLLEITVDGKESYFKSHELYSWLKDRQWQNEFDMNYHSVAETKVPVIASSASRKK